METEIVSQEEPGLGHEVGKTMLLAGAAAAASVVGMAVGLVVVGKVQEWNNKRRIKRNSAYNKSPKEESQ